jgi:hypothetical protein
LSRHVLRGLTTPMGLGSPDQRTETRTREYQIARAFPNRLTRIRNETPITDGKRVSEHARYKKSAFCSYTLSRLRLGKGTDKEGSISWCLL